MKEFIAEMVNGSLAGELDDELGYDKYDVENKETDNSRNGFGHKTTKLEVEEIAKPILGEIGVVDARRGGRRPGDQQCVDSGASPEVVGHLVELAGDVDGDRHEQVDLVNQEEIA